MGRNRAKGYSNFSVNEFLTILIPQVRAMLTLVSTERRFVGWFDTGRWEGTEQMGPLTSPLIILSKGRTGGVGYLSYTHISLVSRRYYGKP